MEAVHKEKLEQVNTMSARFIAHNCKPTPSKFVTYHTKNDCYKHSFFPHTIYNWNRLPQTGYGQTEQLHCATSTFINNSATFTSILSPTPSNQP